MQYRRAHRRRGLGLLVATVAGVLGPGLATRPASAGIDGEIVYARSLDGGATFGGYANLSEDSAASELPHVAAAGGVVQAVWKSRKENPEREDILARRSGNGGDGFEGVADLTPDDGDPAEPEVAVHNGRVLVAYDEEVDGTDDALALVGDAGDASFLPAVNISKSRTATKDPDVTLADGFAVAVFEEEVQESTEDIFATRSGDGARWSEAVNLSRDGVQSSEPTIWSTGTAVHVMWEDEGDELDVTDDAIGYARSGDGGQSWSDPVKIPAGIPLVSPAVAAVGNVVHLAACSPADASGIVTSDAWYLRSTDGGATWEPRLNLSDSPGDCDNPTVAAHGGRVYVAWSDTNTGRSEILLRASTDDGGQFAPTQNVSRTPGESKEPTLAVDPGSGAVHLVWTDFSVQPAAPLAVLEYRR